MLMCQHGHMSTHQPANWTVIDPCMRLRGAMAKWVEWIGLTGTVGPVSGIVRVASWAQWATQSDNALSPSIGNKIHSFLPCGTK